MKLGSLQYLCCPVCHEELSIDIRKQVENEIISGKLECHKCQREYYIKNGIPDFVVLQHLSEEDEKWMKIYDKMASSYDLFFQLISLISLGWELRERRKWIKKLEIKEGDMVLDVATGTGRNLPYVVEAVGNKGKIFAMDISMGMLAYAKVKVKKKRMSVELQRANAAYLPYKDNLFDAVFHVGGINTFGEKKKAIEEMVRVAKPGAKIVIVDEGFAPGKEKTFIGKQLLKTNILYLSKPPIDLLPKNIEKLRVSWVLHGTFYLMEFKKTKV